MYLFILCPKLLKFIPKIAKLNHNVRDVPGLDDQRRTKPIKNMNKTNTPEEIVEINRKLSGHIDLLEFHGYKILDA